MNPEAYRLKLAEDTAGAHKRLAELMNWRHFRGEGLSLDCLVCKTPSEAAQRLQALAADLRFRTTGRFNASLSYGRPDCVAASSALLTILRSFRRDRIHPEEMRLMADLYAQAELEASDTRLQVVALTENLKRVEYGQRMDARRLEALIQALEAQVRRNTPKRERSTPGALQTAERCLARLQAAVSGMGKACAWHQALKVPTRASTLARVFEVEFGNLSAKEIQRAFSQTLKTLGVPVLKGRTSDEDVIEEEAFYRKLLKVGREAKTPPTVVRKVLRVA